MSLILSGSDGVSDIDGSAATPAIRGTDSNTGIFFPAADTIGFAEGGAEVARFDSSGNLGIGTTSPATPLHVRGANNEILRLQSSDATTGSLYFTYVDSAGTEKAYVGYGSGASNDFIISNALSGDTRFNTNGTERARITSGGALLVAKTVEDGGTSGFEVRSTGFVLITRNADLPLYINRTGNDGTLVSFRQDNTEEGTISVSGSTVSYNGGNLSRWAQLTTPKDDTPLFKGTVMSNLDEMNVYTDAEGNPVDNEQLNKVKVSDVEGDINVAGVFVNWDYDDAHQVDEINMAMTGDMIIRIAQGVVVQKGDLLMSAGDGTAKPQGDDIVRSKTVAKVTSNHVTCTYADGSYCVPCVLMAC